MKEMTLTIEVVTPAFLSGADQGAVELRAASVRGELRWWWRALHANLGVEELRRREATLFGSTETGTKSPLRVGVELKGPLKVIPRGTSAPSSGIMYEYRRRGRSGTTDVLPYLAYGPIRLLSKQEKEQAQARNDLPFLDSRGQPKRGAIFIRPAIAPGTRFRLKLTWRDDAIDSSQQQELVEAASAWLALGGLGTRSRKGFGSLHLIAVEGEPVNGQPTEKAMRSAIQSFRSNGEPLQAQVPRWPSAVHRIVHLSQPFPTWQQALGTVGVVYKNKRPKGGQRWIAGDANPRRASSVMIAVARDRNQFRGIMALLPATKEGDTKGSDAMVQFASNFKNWVV